MRRIILVAETGSDITPELAKEYGIVLVPMHVAFDTETLDDGTFPPEKIVDFYKETGKLPKTSGSTPEDFMKAFDKIHEEYPDAQILYLAYSAITTCSYQSAVIASEDRDYVTAVDTRQVSVGQCNVVIAVAQMLQQNPEMSVKEAAEKAVELCDKAKMCFLPNDLEFLKAGGRVSNVVCLGSRLLGIHPVIEILEGKLVATKKYRGKMNKVVEKLIREYADEYQMDRSNLWFIYTVGLTDDIRMIAENTAKDCGFEKVQWVKANGVITTHGGPEAIGIAGFTR